jgi:replicative DNA helicase
MELEFQLESDVLGKIFLDDSLMNETALLDYHFENEQNRNIFKVCKHLHEKGHDISPISFLNFLGKDKLENKIGWKYLSDISISSATIHDYEDREKDVIENWKKRQIKQILQDVTYRLAAENDLSSLPQYIKQITDVYSEGEKEEFEFNDSIARALDRYADKRLIQGIKTGFTELDIVLNGLMKKEYIVIGARPGMGKTAFAINLIDSILEKNKNSWCYMFSLEMSVDEMIDREFAKQTNIPLQRLTGTENVSDNELQKLTTAAGFMSNIFNKRLYINDKAGSSMQDVWGKVSRYKNKQPKESHGIVLIDYLTLLQMGGKKYSSRQEEVSEISRSLKRLAKELDVTVIAVSQLNRGNEMRQNKRPNISDLRESGQVEQDANTIILLYRDDYYDKDTEKKNIIEAIVAKNRRGPTGIVELAFIKELMKFVNLERRKA